MFRPLHELFIASILTAAVSAAYAACGVPPPSCNPIGTFDPTNPAASGYNIVFQDTFLNSSTIDTAATHASGFHWYISKFFGYGNDPPGNITTGAGGLVINSSPFPGQNFDMSTATDNGSGGFVGTVFGNGAYFEISMSFDGPSVNTSNGWPSFWSMAVEHMQGVHNDQWPGQAAGYEHFIEDDFFEYDAPLGDGSRWGAAIHDWQGNPLSQLFNNGASTPYNNFLQTKPGAPAITWNVATFHTLGQLWVAGSATNGQQGYIQTYLDGVASISGAQSSKVGWTDGTMTTPAAMPNTPAMFSIQDQDNLVVILGTGVSQPFHVNMLRVWQIPGCGIMTVH